ncbi:MAG: RNA polymerase sigma factor [Terracidiphilus sp.]|nr:RNA polymerase sigma factor [Terracidiphilus sp.]MDR3797367.1 RNA polymerase sigma factor [Terracidiphilus sp.]
MNDQQSEYERLIAPIEGRMIRAVWRIVQEPNDADDALQEALLIVWKRWSQIRVHPNPHALVLRICIQSGYDMLRRKKRRLKWQDADAIPEAIPDTAASPIQRVSDHELGEQALQAIVRLSKHQAQAILMHAVEEIPYSDIALAMNCREATVRKHVARARTRLRTLLSHRIPVVHKEDVHA